MPVYTFRLRDGHGDVEDTTGVQFSDRDSALGYARDVVDELMRSREDALLVSGCLRGRRGRQSDRRNPIRQRRSEPGPPHTQIPGYGGIRVRTQTPAQRRDPYSQRYPHGIAGAGGAGTRQAPSGDLLPL